jgi:hypothetical protein
MLEDFIAAYEYLKSHKDCNGHIGGGVLFWRLDCQYDGSQNSRIVQQFLIMEDNPLLKKPNK